MCVPVPVCVSGPTSRIAAARSRSPERQVASIWSGSGYEGTVRLLAYLRGSCNSRLPNCFNLNPFQTLSLLSFAAQLAAPLTCLRRTTRRCPQQQGQVKNGRVTPVVTTCVTKCIGPKKKTIKRNAGGLVEQTHRQQAGVDAGLKWYESKQASDLILWSQRPVRGKRQWQVKVTWPGSWSVQANQVLQKTVVLEAVSSSI